MLDSSRSTEILLLASKPIFFESNVPILLCSSIIFFWNLQISTSASFDSETCENCNKKKNHNSILSDHPIDYLLGERLRRVFLRKLLHVSVAFLLLVQLQSLLHFGVVLLQTAQLRPQDVPVATHVLQVELQAVCLPRDQFLVRVGEILVLEILLERVRGSCQLLLHHERLQLVLLDLLPRGQILLLSHHQLLSQVGLLLLQLVQLLAQVDVLLDLDVILFAAPKQLVLEDDLAVALQRLDDCFRTGNRLGFGHLSVGQFVGEDLSVPEDVVDFEQLPHHPRHRTDHRTEHQRTQEGANIP
jgi:hypothetical protein